ncbi:MAG TPA: helix-turn-helix domain-containing protein, partial [Pseudomonadota bacterium]|nr:helix-turn-helix domain-containing protein [Pseudomonadota bacterium]
PPAGLASDRSGEPGGATDARRDLGRDAGSGAEFRLQPSDLSIKLVTRRLEMALIRRALIKTRGNRSAAAKLLELSHRALLYKLREYGLK